jgi:spore coat protein JB
MNLPLAYPYVPPQRFGNRYADDVALTQGTLFPELDLPFHGFQIERTLPKTPMTDLMAIDFVCLELRLYLDINPHDAAATELYNEYKNKSAMAKQKLNFDWVTSPWPWEGEV